MFDPGETGLAVFSMFFPGSNHGLACAATGSGSWQDCQSFVRSPEGYKAFAANCANFAQVGAQQEK
jgi:hypothetical protein